MQNLFSIQDVHIKDQRDDLLDLGEGDGDNIDMPMDNPDYPDSQPTNDDKINLDFPVADNEFEKKLGRLYKTFDVRFVKNTIWNTISNWKGVQKEISDSNTDNNTDNNTESNAVQIENNKDSDINFREVINNISDTMARDGVTNISTSTCFVCLLHLANEKSKLIYY